jgi:hypothetical protein
MEKSAGRRGWSVAALFTLLAALAALSAGPLGTSVAEAAPAVAVSPLNGTPDASPDTQISFLGVPSGEISSVSVRGSRTGAHSGHLRAYATAPGASFVVDHTFSQGENVTASALVGPKGHTSRVSTSFTIARLAPYAPTPGAVVELSGHGLEQNFVSQPRLKPPVVRVTANAGVSAGDIFLTPTHGYGQSGAMILDPQGRLLWFHPVPKGVAAANLQVQTYQGAPVLTWWYGTVPSELGVGFGRDEIMSTSYKPIASVGAGNGYQADLHEFQITPQGSAFLTAYSLVSADLSSAGGRSDGILQDAILQEVDIPTGLVMFEWHAYGHVALWDSYSHAPYYTNKPFDYFHLNSVSLDPSGDGDFIISSRNTWTAYEINHITGGILWRLGGRHSSFKMGPGTGIAYQHDVRWQPDRTLTIFDNGAAPAAHSETRLLREKIDFVHRAVHLVTRWGAHILSGSQGDFEALPSGGYFVGWGEAPYMTEYGSGGQILFSARFPQPGQSYRAYRFPWQGTPASEPAIAVKHGSGGDTVYASWNGASGVTAWRLLGGSSPSALYPLATVSSAGFETAIAVPGSPAYLAVQPLGASGQPLGISGAAQG